MNPFSILINYVIANSRASFYNVSGNQEITNTALLAGAVSENPLLNYLIIENKAKIEGDKFVANKANEERDVIPGTGTTTSNAAGNTSDETKGTATTDSTSVNVVTLQSLETKILENTSNLQNQIAAISENNKGEVERFIAEKLNPKIEALEKSNTDINIAIQEIKSRLEAISKPESVSGTSTISDQKPPVKNVKR
ncbi:hypothetical protein EYY60_20315 [Flavobacterium zhairuonense]|uniref:hypothetical protein n=1 Tax=Flavobacterium zhairuonense TaxID=2493631 RepID=UPI0010519C77|nr:hypothetical protein [Flavobacterium zhairuonense]KAF2506863.1 hypothetical protein EYY60_20315 [Flavobacterium zhairuonense]